MSNNISFKSFNTQATEYDGHNAYILAQLCRESYRRENVKELKGKSETNEDWRQRVNQEAVSWGFESDHVYCFDHQGAQAILLADNDKVILVFRGSDEKSDWDTNFNRKQDEMLNIQLNVSVHGGFVNYVKRIWQPYPDPKKRIEAKGIEAILLDELKNSAKTLWITGHSLGGAAATLAAITCIDKEKPIQVNGVYTYGQPRVGDNRFADVYNTQLKSKTFRFVNNNDIVTRIPTWAPYFFFAHVGQMKYLTESGDIIDFEKLNVWQRLRNAFAGLNEDLLEEGFDAITDHSMATGYIPPLRRALSK